MGQAVAGVLSYDMTLQYLDEFGRIRDAEAVLRYDPADPYAVTMQLRDVQGRQTWTFGRDLLSKGITQPAGHGAVHVWPCIDARGRAVAVIEFDGSEGELIAQGALTDFMRFVARSLALVPAGTEHEHLDMDAMLEQLLLH